jgi:hypothetical protein
MGQSLSREADDSSTSEEVSDNSDDKNVERKYSQINKVVVSQELECGGDKKGVNKDKTMILEETRDITDNTQSESVDKIVETRRTSTRNKKTPGIRGNNFFMLNKVHGLKSVTNTKKLKKKKNPFKIFHQNIRGLE